MSFFGTFLTRSGVISSVHSFADQILDQINLAFLVVMMLLFVALYTLRADGILPANVDKAWGPSVKRCL